MARIVSASSFSRSFTASSTVAMISLLGSVLEVIEKLRPFGRRLVSIWVSCLEDISITHFFLSVILVTLCVMQERMHINHVIRDRLENSIEQLKGKILESITPDEFHLVEKIHENLYKKYFEFTKKRHIH